MRPVTSQCLVDWPMFTSSLWMIRASSSVLVINLMLLLGHHAHVSATRGQDTTHPTGYGAAGVSGHILGKWLAWYMTLSKHVCLMFH